MKNTPEQHDKVKFWDATTIWPTITLIIAVAALIVSFIK